MCKITSDITPAFMRGIHVSDGNTTVTVCDGESKMYLHGNLIATRNLETCEIRVTTAGWNSNLTKDRLNRIPGCRVNTKRGELYLNGVEWDGSWITL